MTLKSCILALHAALFAILLAVSPAGSGSMTLLGVGKVGGGAPLPTLTYIALATATVAGGTTATATNAAIGTAASDRLVVVILYNIAGNPNTPTMTIGGGTATQVAFNLGNNGAQVGIYTLNVTSGTTATIVATTTGGFSDVAFDVYTLNGLSSMTAVGGNSTGSGTTSTLTTTVATTSGGVVIAGMTQEGTGSTTAVASGTETYTADHSNFAFDGFSLSTSAHASGVATNASSSVTGTWNGSGNASIAVGSWR